MIIVSTVIDDSDGRASARSRIAFKAPITPSVGVAHHHRLHNIGQFRGRFERAWRKQQA